MRTAHEAFLSRGHIPVTVGAFKDGIRAVWHLDVTGGDVPLAVEAVRQAVRN